MVLPHFDPVGKSNDIEVILGSEVMEDPEEGILGLGKHKTKISHINCISPRVSWFKNCTPEIMSALKLRAYYVKGIWINVQIMIICFVSLSLAIL